MSVLSIDMRRVSVVSLFLKSVFLTGMVVLLVFAFFGSADAESKPFDDKAVRAVNSLAFDLYAKLKTGKGELCFSPYSISSAFAMLYAGASGDTAAEMEKVFKYDDGIHESNGALMERLNKTPASAGELRVANSIWPMKSYSFLKSYTDLLHRNYGTDVTPLDYMSSPEPSRRRINKWVEDKTKNRITDILAVGSIVPDTRMVLVNAIYFKSKWMHTFHEDMTTDADFYLSNGKTTMVKMMNGTDSYRYAEPEGLQVLELPYWGGVYSILLLLPEDKDGLPSLERRMSEKLFTDIRTKLSTCKVNVFLPKFRVESTFNVGETVGALGMKMAFSKQADFSKMNGQMDLFVSSAVHKAFVEVDEKGAEAAAATAIVVNGLTAMPEKPNKMVVFRADHPFIFLIHDNASGIILFMGRVTKP